MNRRTTLIRLVGLGTTGLAGCVSGSDGGDRRQRTTQTAMTSTLDDATIVVQRNDCGQTTSDATVSFGEHVAVSGTIWAPDPGWTAVLSAASYDADDDELTVAVGVEPRDDSGPVVQCIAEIEYRVTATFSDGLPGSVTVTHETDEGVATVATATA
ncbi:hypothetical protein [Halomicrobium mukohataei]